MSSSISERRYPKDEWVKAASYAADRLYEALQIQSQDADLGEINMTPEEVEVSEFLDGLLQGKHLNENFLAFAR